MTTQDFIDYRAELSESYKAQTSLTKHIINIRAMFKWGLKPQVKVLSVLPEWFDAFNTPTDSEQTKYQNAVKRKHGEKTFEVAEIKKILEKCGVVERAMVLLGLNCGYGNTDLAGLPLQLVNLTKATIDFPRTKTGAARKATLWPETVSALKAAIDVRPKPISISHKDLVFLTATGQPLVSTRRDGDKITRSDNVTNWFRDLQSKAGVYRQTRGLYGLRHTLATAADEAGDSSAGSRIMGHKLAGMKKFYVNVKDSRLKAVTDYVREQFCDAIAEPVKIQAIYTPPGGVHFPVLEL